MGRIGKRTKLELALNAKLHGFDLTDFALPDPMAAPVSPEILRAASAASQAALERKQKEFAERV